MRTVILKDTKIPKDELLALLDEYTEFIENHMGITPVFWVEQHDFSQVPTVVDPDGDMKPSPQFRKELVESVYRRYNEYGTDNVVMLVHEDNFLYKGIWGQNWSYIYRNYSFQLVRWDKDNPANSFGTLNHEIMHSFDTLVLKEIGFEINDLFGLDWDKYMVHGGRPDKEGTTEWKYVRHKENAKALGVIAPYVKVAYAKRKDKHDKHVGLLKQAISLLSTIVSLLKKKSSV